MIAKLTSSLAEHLNKVNSSDLVDIILELHPAPEPKTQAEAGNRSRQEKIAAKKEAFTQTAAFVEEAVRRVGGEITGLGWINHTVRARVPAEGVKELSEHEQISILDIPHPLKSDFG